MVSMPSPPRPFILAPLHCFLASTVLRSIHTNGETNTKLDGPPRAICLEDKDHLVNTTSTGPAVWATGQHLYA
jgi:hypothetical protein